MSIFVDIVTITCKAGNGGNGGVSFHREKYVSAGGPDGGDGGKGGDIIFVASERMHTLMDFRYRRSYSAQNGEAGMSGRRKGKTGESQTVEVPVGTIVRDKQSGRVLMDMNEPGVERVLLRGGNGGFGNARFATPTRRAPNFAKPGMKTETLELTLELKSIADVGLVGFPNVGKSTLLSAVTSARPKIADYHFTTLTPNLGIVQQDDDGFIMADIPGLVEGASEGIGLGHDFLRHVERTRLLIHVLDISGCEGRDPLEDYDAIMNELEKYGDLKDRPMIIAANKTDIALDGENLRRLIEKVGTEIPVYSVSAATRSGLTELMRAASSMLRELPPPEPFIEEELPEPDEEAPYEIEFSEGAYIVSGASIERLINSVNFDDFNSLNWFHRTMKRRGIIDELRRAGAQEGDTVIMEGVEFDFVE